MRRVVYIFKRLVNDSAGVKARESSGSLCWSGRVLTHSRTDGYIQKKNGPENVLEMIPERVRKIRVRSPVIAPPPTRSRRVCRRDPLCARFFR